MEKLSSLSIHNKLFLTSILFALILRIPAFCVVYTATVNAENLFATRMINNEDSRDYVKLAQNMVEIGQYTTDTKEPYRPELKRVPGYPVFLSGLYILAGFRTSPFLILLANLLLSLSNLYLIMKIGEKLFNPTLGILASFIYALAPITIALMSQALSETLFTTLLLISTYAAISVNNMDKRHDFIYVVISSITLGLAVNVRAIALYILPLYMILWFIQYRFDWQLLKLGIISSLLFVACLAPWFFRNWQTFSYLTFSSVSDINLIVYNAPSILSHQEGISLRNAKDKLAAEFGKRYDTLLAENGDISEQEINSIRHDVAMEILLANPLETIFYHFVDSVQILRPGYSQINLILEDDPDAYGNNVNTGKLPILSELSPVQFVVFAFLSLYYGLVYLLVLIGGIVTLFKKRLDLILVLLVLPYWFAYVPSVAGNSRFRVPIEGFMAILAAIALMWLYERFLQNICHNLAHNRL